MGARMNILILISHPGSFGGTHRVAINLANRMSSDYNVHLASVYGSSEKLQFDLDPRVSTTVFLPEEDRLRSMAWALRRPLVSYLKQHDIDVVLLEGNYQGFVALPTILTYSKPRYIFCDHGALMNQWDARPVRWMRRWCSRLCAATVTLTHQSRRDYIQRFRLPADKVHAIYNWLDPQLTSRQVTYDVDSRILLWAGRLDEEKGADLLLDIARQLLPRFPQWRWLVFGTGEMHEQMTEEIARLGLDDQLLLCGQVTNLYEEYPKSSIVTLTSYREGLPLVLLEGKACGRPLISFDVSTGPAELIRDGVDGFLIPPFDTVAYAQRLAQMMGDDRLRLEMARRSQDTVSMFDQETIYAQWRKLLEGLCPGAAGDDTEGAGSAIIVEVNHDASAVASSDEAGSGGQR